MKNKLAAWIALGLIAVVAALCLAATNEVTKDVIEQQNVEAMQGAWRTLVPGAEFPEGIAAAESEEGVPEAYVYEGTQDGQAVGYVAQTTVQGYGGEIAVIVGTDTEGAITGISVGGAGFSETAGLGAKAKEPAFTDQFAGKTAPLELGEDIDAITASTITSSAVVRGVNASVESIAAVAGFTIDMPAAEAGEIGDGRYAAETKGFAGPVYVEIQLDDADTITEIVIGNDQFAETAGYGQKALDPAFYEQFIGKTGQLTLGEDIDVIAGATITSQAVVDAVNTAMLFATDPEAAAAAAASADAFELPEVPDGALTETASSKGFGGPVAATITIDPDTHALLRVEFGDDAWAETDGIGTRIQEDSFWQQFIGRTLPLAPGDVDTLSGATVTSQAAIDAVNKAYGKLFPAEGGEDEAPAASSDAIASGTETASSKGFVGPVAAEITAEDGVLTAVTFGDDSFAETEGLGTKVLEAEFAEQFVGKSLPLADGDIDIIAGSTVTSEAAIAAVNKAYEKLQAATGEDTTPDTAEVSASESSAASDAIASGTETASSKGFAGPVAAEITAEDGVLTAVTFGDDSFAETEGLGTKVLEAEFAEQFVGKSLPLADGDIDIIAGSTVTSEAAIAAVNKAYEKLQAATGEDTTPDAAEVSASESSAASDAIASGTETASSKGFAGPVAAEITAEDGILTAVTFGDDSFAETEGLGTKILEPDFAAQFVGKSLPLADGDIDIIAGSTVTSEAAIAAVNKAYEKLQAAAPVAGEATPEDSATEAPATSKETSTTPASGTETASSKGFAGPVAAEITAEDGVLTAVTFGDDSFAETEGLGTKILEADFAEQFVGKSLPLADGDIDIIAGSTVTSEAAIAAVNKAYEKLQAAAPAAGEVTPEDSATEAPATEGGTEAPATSKETSTTPASGTETASSKGFAGPVAAEITAEDGILTAVTFGDDSFAETEGLGTKVLEAEFAEQFVGKSLPLADGDIDIIAGSTVTSEAAIAAVNKAYEKLQAAAPEGETTPEGDTEEPARAEIAPTATPKAPADKAVAPSADIIAEAGGDNTVYVTGEGRNGPIHVGVTVTDMDTIEAIAIGDEDFAETEGIGAKVLEQAFLAQFTGKALPLEDGDIDLITGATVSSQAVVDAVNEAFRQLRDGASGVPAPETAEASAKGYGGPVAARITVVGDQLTDVSFGDDAFAETEGLGTKITEDDFMAQFIGKALPLAEGDIDTIAGATVSAEAAIAAVNKAYAKIEALREEALAGEADFPPNTVGEAEASAKGYGGPVTVGISVNEGMLQGIHIDSESFQETEGIGTKVLGPAFTAQLIGMMLPIDSADVDIIAGATVSSNAVIEAINKAFEKLSGQ